MYFNFKYVLILALGYMYNIDSSELKYENKSQFLKSNYSFSIYFFYIFSLSSSKYYGFLTTSILVWELPRINFYFI